MILKSMTCVALFAAGYAASVYSWPTIRSRCNGVEAEAGRLRNLAAQLWARLRGTIMSRIRKVCLNSLTIAWSYCLAIAGTLLEALDHIVDPLADSQLRAEISAAIGDPGVAGRILLGISLITIVVRLRSLRRAA